MSSKMAIRVTLEPDGKTPRRTLYFDGEKVGDVSYIDLIEFLIQAPSTLRFEVRR